MPTLGELFPDAPTGSATPSATPPTPRAPTGRVTLGELFPEGPQAGAEATAPPGAPQTLGGAERPSLSWPEEAALFTAQVGVPILAGAAGTAVSANPLVGLAAGGAASGGIEAARQAYEKWRGVREDYDVPMMGLQTGLGVIPGAPLERMGIEGAKRFAARAAEGGLLAGGGATAQTYLQEGRLPTLGELFPQVVLGTAIGGSAGLIERGAGRALDVRVPEDIGAPGVRRPPPDVTPPTPGVAEPGASTRYGEPPFMAQRGMHQALHGEPITPAVPRPHEKFMQSVEAIDTTFADRPVEQRNLMKTAMMFSEDDIAKQVRQQQPVKRTLDLADEINVDPTQVKPGQAMNAEQIAATAQYVDAATQRFDHWSQEARANPTPENQLQRQMAAQKLIAGISAFQGGRAEAGRALNILKYQMEASESGNPLFIRRALRLGAHADEIARVLESTDPMDDITRFRMLRDMQKPTWRELGHTYFVTNLLSSPKTQERNILGNLTNLFYTPLSTPFAAGAEALGGGPRTVFAGEVPEQLAGMWRGLSKGYEKFAYVLKHGHDPEAVHRLELPHAELFQGAHPYIERSANIVTRLLGGADQFFRTVGTEMELAGGSFARARAQALREVEQGAIPRAQLSDRINDLQTQIRANPPDDLVRQADTFATRRVFQEGGAVDQALMSLRDAAPLSEFVIPFIKTPIAIIRQSFQASPAGFFTGLGKGEGRLAAQARGEAALGTALLVPFAMLAWEGKLSGAGPSDPAERDAFFARGGRPNAIQIGDQWVPYTLLQPIAPMLALIGNGFDAYRDAVKRGDPDAPLQAQEIVSQALAGAGKSLLQQSTLKGISDVLNAVSDPERYGASYLSGLATGFVPGVGALRTVRQAMDPVIRQPEGIVESIQNQLPPMTIAGVPIGSQTVPPRLRATGEVVQQEMGPLGRALSPVDIGTVQPQPILDELDRIGVKLTLPRGEKVGGQTLTDEEDLALRQAKGQAATRALEELFAQPGYQASSLELQAKIAQRRIEAIRSRVQIRATAAKRQGRVFNAGELAGAAP